MRHLLNGVEITPRNRDSIGIVSTFEGNPDELSLNVDSLVLPREGFEMIKQHIATVGLFEGVPYSVESGGVTLDYYIDLTDPSNTFRSFECEVKIKRRKAIDNFIDNAAGTSFELMLKKGINFSTFNVPYVIIKDNQTELALITGITLYMMTTAFIESIKDLATTISQGVQASTPNAGVPPSIDTGDIISFIINVTAQVVYVAAQLLAIIQMATKFYTLIFPPVRNLLACTVWELLTVSCGYLGYSFESSLAIDYPNYTILPVPLVRNRKSIFDFVPEELTAPFNKGVPSSSDTTPTIGTLLQACETIFNARTRVVDGVVRFERRDYWANVTPNVIIPALNLQAERTDEFSYNVDDVWKRYYIHYNIDPSDIHTMDKIYNYSDAEYSTEPTNVVNADLVCIKGLNDVNVPFAMGARKENLNWLEKLVKGMFEFIDFVTGIFGGGTNFAATIENRKGVLMVSQNYFTVTKLLYCVNGRQQPDYLDWIAARSLWGRFHAINQIQLNDYIVKNEARIQMTQSEFVTLLNNNFAEINGVMCEILRIEWIDEKSFAQITYRERNNYALGKVTTLTIND
jgi:hypothetical protein